MIAKLLRALTAIVLSALMIFGALMMAGCSALAPSALTVAGVHASVPFKGPGPAPFGDGDRTAESTMNGLQAGVEWGTGLWFADFSVTYAPDTRNMEGGPWFSQARAGIRWRTKP